MKEFHEVAEIFPLMEDCEFKALCRDIAQNGLREPIWMTDGKIIDGRNRYNACLETKTDLEFREWDGVGELVDFVVSQNLRRRHLTDAQRALVAGRLANLSNGQKASKVPNAVPQAAAAEMLNVSPKSVERAVKVQKSGVTELQAMVERDEISLTAAAELAARPKGQQKRLIKKGRERTKQLLNKVKTRALQTVKKTGTDCLCGTERPLTADEFIALLELLETRQPQFARYISPMIEELTEEELSDNTRESYKLIFDAIDLGYQTLPQLLAKTRLEKDVLEHTLSQMLDYKMLEATRQGGKTLTARGAPNTLYQRREVTEFFAEKPLKTIVKIFSEPVSK